MIRMLWDCDDFFYINPAWAMEVEPGDIFIMLYDDYGFFTHVSYEMWESEVLEELPENFTSEQLDAKVRAFMSRYQYLFVCNN